MKKFLSMLLILVLMVSVIAAFPFPAEAAPLDLTASDGTEFVTVFNDAKNNPDGGGGTITLTGDINLEASSNLSATAGNPVIVNTGTHVINVVGSSYVTIGDNVRIISNAGSNYLFYVTDDSTLTIEEGAAISKNIDDNLPAVYIDNGGALHVMGGAVSSQTISIYAEYGGYVDVTGGTITASNYGVFSNGSRLINISGGVITATASNGVGVFVANGAVANIGNNADINGGFANGCAIEVEFGGEANISDGEIGGADGISASGVVNITGGYINGNMGSGIRIEPDGEVTIDNSEIYGNVNGILLCEDESDNGGNLVVNGGGIAGNNYGIEGCGTIEIKGGIIEGLYAGSTEETGGIGVSITGGTLTMYGGTASGSENGISVSSESTVVIYGGDISATGEVFPYSIYVEGDPPLTIYSAATLNKDIYIDSEEPENYIELDSFNITAPAAVELTVGEDGAVDFTVVGQKLNGDLITLQDLTGASGILSNATYTVSGNTITFTPVAAGNDTLTVNDTITYNGQRNIAVNNVNQNIPPTVGNLIITGDTIVGGVLTGNYTFEDADNDSDASTFQWYRTENTDGTGKVEINGAVSNTYTLTSEDIGKYILFEVTAIDSRSLAGNAALSGATLQIRSANDIAVPIERISVSGSGTQSNGPSASSNISSDGRYVTFVSNATNLISGDTNNVSDVFVYDRQTGDVTRVSAAADGTQGNAANWAPSISAEGRYVVFVSDSSNLVPGDTNGIRDIFLHDRQTGETSRVNAASDGTQANNNSFLGEISADGRYVVFHSFADNLVSGDTNNTADIFIHDLQTGATTLISVSSEGVQGNSSSGDPRISPDGRYVVFESTAGNLVPGDTNNKKDIFVRDIQTGQTARVSVASDGTQGNNISYRPSITADGRYVVFESYADNLVSDDTNSDADIFMHDRQTGQTTLISEASDGTQGNGCSQFNSISADGRYIAFGSYSSNLVSDDTNNKCDVFVHNRQTGETIRISNASDATQGNDYSSMPSISEDGTYVAFESDARNLAEEDTNNAKDIFVWQNAPGQEVNHAPIADPGGPYQIYAGECLSLDGSGSSDPDEGDSIVSYEWDLNNNGVFNDAVDAAGVNPTVTSEQLLALNFQVADADTGLPKNHITLRVTDMFGSSDTNVAAITLLQPVQSGGLDNWTVRNLNSNYLLYDIAYGNGKFVAVGMENYLGTYRDLILFSSDGEQWTAVNQHYDKTLNAVTYVDAPYNAFFVAGNEGTLLTSEDGSSWSKIEFSNVQNMGNQLFEIAYGNNTLVAPSDYVAFYSTYNNGWAWDFNNRKLLDNSGSIYAVTYGNNQFVAMGNRNIYISPDGFSGWTRVSTSGSVNIYDVVYNGLKYVAVGGDAYEGFALVSENGNDWSQYTTNTPILKGVVWGDNRFIAVSKDESIFSSMDGETWTQCYTFDEQPKDLYGVAFGNNTYVAVGADGIILQSDPVSEQEGPLTLSMASFTPVTFTQIGTIADDNVQCQNAAAVIAALPANITVTLEDSSTAQVSITWTDTDGYDAAAAGSYTFTGSWGDLPEGVDNDDQIEAPVVEVEVVQGAVEDNEPPTWPTFSSLIATNISSIGVSLKWSPAVDNIDVTEYKIYCDGNELATVAGDVTTYQVTGLAQNTMYTFKVEAGDAAGNRTTDGPTANNPVSEQEGPLTLSMASFTSVTFTQTGTIADDNVQCQNAAAVIAALPANITVTLEDSSTAQVSITWTDTDGYDAAAAGSYTFTGSWGDLPEGVDNDDQIEAPVVEVEVVQGAVEDNEPPAWPAFSSLITTNISSTSVSLKWSPAVDNIDVTEYKIYCDGNELATVAGDVTTYQVTGLAQNTMYTFKVEAGDAAGNRTTDGPTANIKTSGDLIRVITVPANPNDPSQPHYSYNGHLTTFKAVLRGVDPNAQYYYRWDVDGDGVWDQLSGQQYASANGRWYAGKGSDLSGKAYLPDIDSEGIEFKQRTAEIEVATALVNGVPVDSRYGTYPVLQFGDLSPEQPAQASEEQLSILKEIAIDDALWYLHQRFVQNEDTGAGATGYINDGSNTKTNTALYLLAMAENGHFAAYPAGYNLFNTDELNNKNDALYNVNPYAEDAFRAINYLLNALSEMQVTEIDKSDDGHFRIVGSEEYSGLYVPKTTLPEDNCSSLVLAALAKSKLAGSKTAAESELVQGLPFELIVQRMVDAGVASQIDENSSADALGGWTYGPVNNNQVTASGAVNSIISGGWLYALHAAEEEMGINGVYINSRLKNRIANHLYYAQNTDGGCRYTNQSSFSFFASAGYYLLACKWLGWDGWDVSDDSGAGYPYIQITKGQARQVYDQYLQYVIDHWENPTDAGASHGGYLWANGNFDGAVYGSCYAGTASSNLRSKALFGIRTFAGMLSNITSFGAHDWEREFTVSLIKGQHSSGRYTEESGSFDQNSLGTSGVTAYAAMVGADSYQFEITGVSITTNSLPDAIVGTEYTAVLTATGGLQEYTCTWSAAGLPQGLNINEETGVIYGIPGVAGTYTVTVHVVDNAGNEAETELQLTIQDGNGPAEEDNAPPTWPVYSSLTASDIGKNSLTLTWTEAEDNTGVTGYRIYQDENLIATADGNVNTYNITGLTEDTAYTFKIEAGDEAGNWTINGPSTTIKTQASAGGSSKDDGGTPVQTPVPAPTVDSNGNITAAPQLDNNTGVAAAEIDTATLTAAFENTVENSDGKKAVEVVISTVEGATAYESILPASVLSTADADRQLEIRTSIAEVTLPGNMLAQEAAAGAENVSLTITQADISGLDEETSDRIGNRPVIQLDLKVDGEPYVWSNENAPIMVSIPYTPTAEELADPEHITVWYIDGSGNVVEVPSGRYDPATGMVTFSTTHFSNYAVVYVKTTFDDLVNVAWAKKPIEVLASKGILKGKSEKEYAPQANITRADFLCFLIRTLGVDAKVDGNFEDISSDIYYYKEIGIAKSLGITNGTGSNKFSPDAAISRQDMMVLTGRALRMLKLLNQQGAASDLDGFSDKHVIADYAVDSVACLVKEGLIKGDGERINPLGITTRAETAVFLYRIYNLK